MSSPAVAVVDAQTPGNVGTIARAMKNFGFEELLLIDPPELDRDGEAYGYAGQAREDVLPRAREITLGELVSEFHTVAFTSVTNEDESKHVRFPYVTPAELADELAPIESRTALVFGRERVGLTNDELARMDQICAIPASASYPSLNLGQAATVALYELRDLAIEDTQLPERPRAEQREIEGFYDHFEQLLEAVDHPPEKRQKTMRLIRRLIGRAHPTGREITTLRGVIRRAIDRRDD
ncbi:RNA methyltransferase [Halanaeroarchaeum sulfurireducens]|uniref:RNA methyltransferase, TrmH family, group 1 n=1 Tax=Halanaeroarchaeum sulfurireducens TaxID=1604004 RepID=A0A0F7P8T4_9EURY|nr:RNA methyltransferase [Halanaeroarchaeum sulfurireducens]AKH97581.1 RNA methyltransferase, TrmH family, group 1 [Halanaeroarchaeum sulfurireducens]